MTKTGNNNKKVKDFKGTFKRLCGYVLKYWHLFLPAIFLTLLSNQLSLLGPKYSGEAIDAIVAKGGIRYDILQIKVINTLLCYVLSAVLTYVLASLMIVIGQKIVYTMRKQLFEKLTTLPVGYFDTHPTGDIISRISYDIDTINASLSHDVVQIMTSIYTVVGSFIFMWNISKPLVIVVVITVPILIIFTKYRSKKVRPLFSLRSRKLGELNGYAEEMLTGCRSIQAYNRQEVIQGRFDKKNEEAMEAHYQADYHGMIMFPTINFINNLSISLVMIFGGILYMYSQSGVIKAGSMMFITLGGVAQFVQYSRKFAWPINEFANIITEFQSAFSAAERVFRILDEEPEKEDAAGAERLENPDGNVKFNDVVFGYEKGKTILHGISIDAKKGTNIAVVGPTGAGKTTIISLLMRFYDADSGSITVDGKDIREIERNSLRKAFTMVLQDTWLFNGTIFENIAYGKEGATLEQVKHAAKEAMIDTFIESLPDGYDTVITDDGINISKGQRQLITIARAMLADAKMLILDEATSNVDSRTEIKIQEAMTRLMKDKTCFIIAHRLSTIQNADKIIVLQDGKITESGTHDELMEKKGFYSTLYNSQFN